MRKNIDYCKCEDPTSCYTKEEEWGYWDICIKCEKPKEEGFHYYNHYDGEDHDDIDIY